MNGQRVNGRIERAKYSIILAGYSLLHVARVISCEILCHIVIFNDSIGTLKYKIHLKSP